MENNNKLLENYLEIVQENMSEKKAEILATISVIALASGMSALFHIPAALKTKFHIDTKKAVKDLLIKEQRRIIPGLLRIGLEFNRELERDIYIKTYDFNIKKYNNKKEYNKAYLEMTSSLVKNISKIVHKQRKISINDILRNIDEYNTRFFTVFLLEEVYFNNHDTSMRWIKMANKYNEKTWKLYFQPLLILLIKTLNETVKQWKRIKK